MKRPVFAAFEVVADHHEGPDAVEIDPLPLFSGALKGLFVVELEGHIRLAFRGLECEGELGHVDDERVCTRPYNQ